MPQYGCQTKCRRCGTSVYSAELMIGAGQNFHKLKCFRCKDCGKGLDSHTVRERKEEGEIYCAACYGKSYGPKGYGFGGGAGTLSMDSGRDKSGQTKWASSTAPSTDPTVAPSSAGAGPKCPRCGGTVYSAEQMLGAGGHWHRQCFSCADCKQRLDSTQATDNEGEIYCKACYGKNFGPKGFGFGGGAGALAHTT